MDIVALSLMALVTAAMAGLAIFLRATISDNGNPEGSDQLPWYIAAMAMVPAVTYPFSIGAGSFSLGRANVDHKRSALQWTRRMATFIIVWIGLTMAVGLSGHLPVDVSIQTGPNEGADFHPPLLYYPPAFTAV